MVGSVTVTVVWVVVEGDECGREGAEVGCMVVFSVDKDVDGDVEVVVDVSDSVGETCVVVAEGIKVVCVVCEVEVLVGELELVSLSDTAVSPHPLMNSNIAIHRHNNRFRIGSPPCVRIENRSAENSRAVVMSV